MTNLRRDWPFALPALGLLGAVVGVQQGVTWVVLPVAVLLGIVGAVLLAFAGLARLGDRSEQVAHIHASEERLVEVHENGHMTASRKLGGRPVRISKHEVKAGLPRNAPPEHRVAFYHAGRIAAGTREGCSSDEADERRVASYSDNPRKALRDGRALAKRLVG